jgi:hypothetical protein
VRKSDFLSFIIINKKGFLHTFEVAALCERRVEASVDLEADVLGKSGENSLPDEQRARNSGKRQKAVHYHSTSLKDGVGT